LDVLDAARVDFISTDKPEVLWLPVLWKALGVCSRGALRLFGNDDRDEVSMMLLELPCGWPASRQRGSVWSSWRLQPTNRADGRLTQQILARCWG